VIHITNHNSLGHELELAYGQAIQRFPDRLDEIDEVFEAANELQMVMRTIDQSIENMGSKWATETGSKLIFVAQRLSRISNESKSLFTWSDSPVSWRRGPAENIVRAMELEADHCVLVFNSFLMHDDLASGEERLVTLRSQIRQSVASDDRAEVDLVGHNPKRVPSLVEVLSTLAANWVGCECALEVGEYGPDGWNQKSMRLDDEIRSLSDQLSGIAESSKKAITQDEIEKVKAQLAAMDSEWEEVHEETGVHRTLFGDACEFCARECSVARNDLFKAAIGGFNPSSSMSEQGLSEVRLSEIVSRLHSLPRDRWQSEPWANCSRPRIRAVRRVTPEKRDSFISRNLRHDSTASESLGQDDSAKERIYRVPYLGLLFNEDSTVSRLGDKYSNDGACVVSLSRQQFKILKFIHGGGKAGRTKSEMEAVGCTLARQEKNRLNKKLIPLDVRLAKGECKLIHDRDEG